MRYRAVTREELVKIFGAQCSPMQTKDGYVIGPDVNGRLCHIATCNTLREAQDRAERMNTDKGE